MSFPRWIRTSVVATLLPVVLVGGQAWAEDPPLVNWPMLAPGLTPGIDVSSANECIAGRIQCVDAVIRQMDTDFRKLARACDHNAIFALGYLRTTEEYRRAVLTDAFFEDPQWMNHYDAVFAQYYFDAWRSWRTGHPGEVPPAWRETFAAADGREVDAGTNFLLGMNAHINRDLPFVVSAIGTTTADGTSRHPDHTRVNEFLNRVGDDLTPEVAHRFDPTFGDSDVPGTTLDGLAVMQVVQEWRERAWRNAELMNSTDPMTAPLIAQGIEAGSALLAQMIRGSGQYWVQGGDASARDAWCAEHWNDWPADAAAEDSTSSEEVAGADLSQPEPATTLTQLKLLGVGVDVSIESGVTVTLL